jgi:pimeloyl-ACP methyl ester carboxylesterase
MRRLYLFALMAAISAPLAAGAQPQPRPQLQAQKASHAYREKPVKVASTPGVTLACTLTLPAGKGPFAAVVLITGSGAQDRDEAFEGHRPFFVLADDLTRRGVAVLRCDDRGFAHSTGDFASATSLDFAQDTEAEAAALRARHDIDPGRVGLIGHSEGGMIAPMVAARDPKIAFIVMMAGPGAPIRDLMTAQRLAVGRAMGADPAVTAHNAAELAKLDQAVAEATSPGAAEAAVTQIMQADTPTLPAGAIGLQAKYLSSPWYRFFIAHDPSIALAQVKVPILALNGSKDVQVVASVNLPPIREATKANPDVTIVELPGLNHLFQTAGTGAPSEYGQIAEALAPLALSTIGDWVVAHARR